MTLKLALSIAFVEFLAMGFVLATNHPGIALAMGNYYFFSLIAIAVLGSMQDEN